MKDRARKVLVVHLCIFGLTVFSSISQADLLETINLTTGPIYYSAGQFTAPSYEIDGDISFAKFDPSLGYLKKVKLTATILSASSSTIEVENEREDNPQYPLLHAGGWLCGEWVEDTDPHHFFDVTGGMTTAILDVDDEPGSPPDWYGLDYDSFSAAVYTSISDITIVLPDPMYPPEGNPNLNPYIFPFVHMPDTPENWQGYYHVASCMTGEDPAGLLEARFTTGAVSMQLDVTYYYEVPEPATICLFGISALALRKFKK